MSGGIWREHIGGQAPSGPAAVSTAGGAGGARPLGLGVSGARAAGRSRARLWGPGVGAAGAAAPRRPSASVGGKGPARMAGSPAVAGSPPAGVLAPGLSLASVTFTHCLPLGFSVVICKMGWIISDRWVGSFIPGALPGSVR